MALRTFCPARAHATVSVTQERPLVLVHSLVLSATNLDTRPEAQRVLNREDDDADNLERVEQGCH